MKLLEGFGVANRTLISQMLCALGPRFMFLLYA